MNVPLSSLRLRFFVLPLLLHLLPALPLQASEGFAAARFVPERID